jgi:tetratricopeptide (TPR) repeat protein
MQHPATPKYYVWLILVVLTPDRALQAADPPVATEPPVVVNSVITKLPGKQDESDAAVNATPATAALLDAVERYQARIDELQNTGGAFNDALGEALAGLGFSYMNLERYPEALAAFNRSLHIQRVNNGLHNPNQLPLLEAIIATNTAAGNWEALDQNYHMYYWVNRRSYGDSDPKLLPVINRLGQWHLQAFESGADPLSVKHILSAERLYHDAVAIIEAHYGPEDTRLIQPLNGIAVTNYHIASHAFNAIDFNDLRLGTRNLSRLERMQEEEEARQELISGAYRRGKQALLRVIDIRTRDAEAVDHGQALIHLGDWYLLFGMRTTANETYAQAYSKLVESGMVREEIEKLFAQPRSLPAMQMTVASQQQADGQEGGRYAVARFDVSKTGHARNIEIIETHPADDESLRRLAKSTLRAKRFRPRLEAGQPVATAGVNIKYYFSE